MTDLESSTTSSTSLNSSEQSEGEQAQPIEDEGGDDERGVDKINCCTPQESDLINGQDSDTCTRRLALKPISLDDNRPMVVTGFGPIVNGDSNLSESVMQAFYTLNDGYFPYGSQSIEIMTGTKSMMQDHHHLQPVKTSYDFVEGKDSVVQGQDFNNWLSTMDACLFVHLGTGSAEQDDYHNSVHFEFQACNGGNGFVWEKDSYSHPRRYEGECIPGGCNTLQTSFDIDDLLDRIRSKRLLSQASDGFESLSFHKSTDAGHFLCDFLYYRSLFYAKDKDTNVIFMHISETTSVSAEDIALALVQIVQCLLDMCCTAAVDDKQAVTIPRSIRSIQQEPSHPMPTIVVTGFGPIYSPKYPNLSWQVVQKFYSSRLQRDNGTRYLEHNGIEYRLLCGPPKSKLDGTPIPIDTTYEFVNRPSFVNWLTSSKAKLYVHLGVESRLNGSDANCIRFDMRAYNGYKGYWTYDKHNQTYPGSCVDEDLEYRCTQFTDDDIKALVSILPDKVKEEHINGRFAFEQSYDTENATFLCDFLYYRSLYYAETRQDEVEIDTESDDKSYVIFVHIPSTVNNTLESLSLRSNIMAVKATALVLEIIVNGLLDIINPLQMNSK